MADVAEEENKDAKSVESEVILELKRLDDQMLQAQKDFEKEVQRLRHEFQARQTPLMEQRDQVLWDRKDAEDPATGTPALKGFWVTALLNHPAFEDDIESHDIPVLEYLRTIEAEDLDREDADKGFRLSFRFAENPYFTNGSLVQEYHLGEPNRYNGDVSVKELKGCQIHWKAGQDVTMGRANKGGKKKKSGKEVPQKSFFRDHFRSLKAGDDLPEDVDTQQLCMQLGDDDMEEEELVEALLDNAHDAAVALRTQIIPFAVRWYTGEASPEDEDDDEEEQEEEEDKEKDDEVDAENEDGNSRMQGKQEKLQQAAQDCKQQ